MRRILTALKKKVAALLPRRHALAPVPVRRPAPRQGLTLVEMLVTVAITLIIMAAVVNIFASIGKGVQDRRAIIEISNQLRIARTLLAQDLARATATTLPPRDPSSGEGYFEYVEGIHTDWFPTRIADGQTVADVGNLELQDHATWLAPKGRTASGRDANGGEDERTFDDPVVTQYQDYRRLGLSGLGDFDDVLAFTVRSQGEPFIGRFGNTTIKSYEAEVIWFAIENPPVPRGDPRYLGEPGMRTVYRRVLLIAPWLEPQLAAEGAADVASSEGLRSFYRRHDVSARIDLETGRWVPNSLADLTKRENRFAHAPNFPHGIDLERIRFIQVAAGDESRTPLVPLDASENDPLTSINRQGEDIVLTNVLAFDVRAFDPLAPLLLVNNTVVEPSDIGWRRRVNSRLARWEPAYLPNAANPTNIVGRGAYVDLAYIGDPTQGGYEGYDVGTGAATSVFSMAPHARSGFVQSGGLLVRSFYDTWSTHYEYDGINQDRPDLMPDIPATDDLIDEGTNGVDDDGINGVDDAGERETSPPYLSPLRGIEVRFRAYEPDSRAVREVSVKHNFTPQ